LQKDEIKEIFTKNFHLKDEMGVYLIIRCGNRRKRERWHHLHLFDPCGSFAAHD